jgi:hypothetical protein
MKRARDDSDKCRACGVPGHFKRDCPTLLDADGVVRDLLARSAAARPTRVSASEAAAAACAPAAFGDPAATADSVAKRARLAALKAARKVKARAALHLSGGIAAVVTPAVAPAALAFTVDDPRDHAETPFEAYRDIEPLLFRLAAAAGKTKATVRIYDPFFCAGSVVAHLGRLGFASVVNENRDFYEALSSRSVPDFDILVTNPPFSGDHIQRTLSFAARCGKPWAVLIPDFCSRKPTFANALGLPEGAPAPTAARGPAVSPLTGPIFYLGPAQKAYLFSAPRRGLDGAPAAEGADADARVSHVFAATFQCVWHLGLGAANALQLVKWFRKRIEPGGTAVVAETAAALPQLAIDPLRKRREEEQARKGRKKLSRQRKAAARAAGVAGDSDAA